MEYNTTKDCHKKIYDSEKRHAGGEVKKGIFNHLYGLKSFNKSFKKVSKKHSLGVVAQYVSDRYDEWFETGYGEEFFFDLTEYSGKSARMKSSRKLIYMLLQIVFGFRNWGQVSGGKNGNTIRMGNPKKRKRETEMKDPNERPEKKRKLDHE